MLKLLIISSFSFKKIKHFFFFKKVILILIIFLSLINHSKNEKNSKKMIHGSIYCNCVYNYIKRYIIYFKQCFLILITILNSYYDRFNFHVILRKALNFINVDVYFSPYTFIHFFIFFDDENYYQRKKAKKNNFLFKIIVSGKL